jgi:sodium/bile acid cotransporter 7
MKRFLSANSFVVSIFCIVLLAGLLPEMGGPDSPLPIRTLRSIGIFLIFFNQGVQLPGEELRRGLVNWRLHLMVQSAVYLIFPLLTFLLLQLGGGLLEQPDLRRGFLYLSFVPTTITSAVALTGMANGSVSGALFNCTLSAVLGVFITPALSVAFLGAGEAEGSVTLAETLLNVATTILVPLALGQAARRPLSAFYSRHKVFFKRLNSGIILYIIWVAFCQSFLRDTWSQVPPTSLLLTFAGVIFILLTMSAGLWTVSGLAGFPKPVRIAAFFSGSQKTLAMGLPLSALIFPPDMELSLILLPLLIYHPAQLVFGGWMIPRFSASQLAADL